MNYREWKDLRDEAIKRLALSLDMPEEKIVRDTPGFGGPFWQIVDFNWTPEEQNRLAREWKNGAVT